MLSLWFCLLSVSISFTNKQITESYSNKNLNEEFVVHSCIFYEIQHAIYLETEGKPTISISDNLFNKCTAEGTNAAAMRIQGVMEFTGERNCFNQITSVSGSRSFTRDKTISIQVTEAKSSTVSVDMNTFRDISSDAHPILFSPTKIISDLDSEDEYGHYTSFNYNNVSGIRTTTDWGIIYFSGVHMNYGFNTVADNFSPYKVIYMRYIGGSETGLVFVNNTIDHSGNSAGVYFIDNADKSFTLKDSYFYDNNGNGEELFYFRYVDIYLENCYIQNYTYHDNSGVSISENIISDFSPDILPKYEHLHTIHCSARFPKPTFEPIKTIKTFRTKMRSLKRLEKISMLSAV